MRKLKCQAVTESGMRCSRNALDGTKFCRQHQGTELIENDSLTDKQKAFCEEYIIDLNATQAAIRAGYSESTAYSIGYNLLKKVEIQSELQRLMNARSDRLEITADRVLEELARIGFADIKDYLSFRTVLAKIDEDENGEPVYDYTKIVELKESAQVDGKPISEVQLKDGQLKFKLYDKIKALENIGRHLGMWNDKLEITDGDKLEDYFD